MRLFKRKHKPVLGIGPVSFNVIDVVCFVANKCKIPINLVASRGQVECSTLGGGYVTDTKTFSEYVKKRNSHGYVKLSRDHGSFYKNDLEKTMDYREAFESACESLECDIECGFEVLHIDVTEKCGTINDYAKATNLFIEFCEKKRSKHNKFSYEIGIDKHSLLLTNLIDFGEFLKLVDCSHVQYINGNTGLFVMNGSNAIEINSLNKTILRSICHFAHSRNFSFRQHNADYIDTLQLKELSRLGVDAINIAPQYGTYESGYLIQFLQELGLQREAKTLLEIFYNSYKWEKWSSKSSLDTMELSILAGHYNFTNNRVMDILSKIDEVAPLTDMIKTELQLLLKDQLVSCGWHDYVYRLNV